MVHYYTLIDKLGIEGVAVALLLGQQILTTGISHAMSYQECDSTFDTIHI